MDFSQFNIYPLVMLAAVLVVAMLLSGLRSRVLLQAGMYSGALYVTYYTFVAVFSEHSWSVLLQLLLSVMVFYLLWAVLWWIAQKYGKPCHDEGAIGFLLPLFLFPMTFILALLTRGCMWLFSLLFS